MEQLETARGGVEVRVRGVGKLREDDRLRGDAVELAYAIAKYMQRAQNNRQAPSRQNIEAMMKRSLDLFDSAERICNSQPLNDNGGDNATR